jgi:hypothetical protein
LKINLPKPAKDHFNQKADEFLLQLRPAPKEPERSKKSLSTSHEFVYLVITDKELLKASPSGTIDGFGAATSKFFPTEQGPVGLVDAEYVTFEKLTEQIAQRNEVRRFLSTQFVSETFFKWFEGRYKGSIPTSGTFVDYLCHHAEEGIKEIKVAIPLSYVVIEHPFTLGKVKFEYYTAEFFDKFEAVVSEKNPGVDPRGIKHIRSKYQGVVFATMSICAEQHRCVEIASEETEKALTLLRLFSPTTFWPQISSYFGRMGHAHIPVSHYFVFEDAWPKVLTQAEEKADFRLTIDANFLRLMNAAGLSVWGELLAKSELSELEQLLLNSISLFSKSIASSNFQDKIVFALASIETILLKNSTEPIQHFVGLRLAFVTAPALEPRKRIIKVIRAAYQIRSSYLHHGKVTEDHQLLAELLRTIWSAFRLILLNRAEYSTHAEFLDFVENMILS